MSDAATIITTLNNGVEIAATDAAAMAPVISIFNPAAGATMAIAAPIAKTIAVNTNQILITFNAEMTKDEIIKALQESKSANWGITTLETPK